MNLGSKIVGLALVLGVSVFVLGVFFTFGIGAYSLLSMDQPSSIIKKAPAPNSAPTPIRYAPEVMYLVPRHNDYPARIQVRTLDDSRLSITGIGEIFDLRLIQESDHQIIHQQTFVFDKAPTRTAILCLFGVELSTNRCAPMPQEEWKPGDYVFDVVASYPDGSRNSNQRQLHFDRWPGR